MPAIGLFGKAYLYGSYGAVRMVLSVITGAQYARMTRAGSAHGIAVYAVYPAGGQPAESGGFYPLRVKL